MPKQEWMIPDHFDDDVEEHRPSASPVHRPSDTPQSLFARLAQGRTIGKSVNYMMRSAAVNPVVPLNLFELSGQDDFAQPLCISLLPPKVKLGSAIPGFPNIDPNSVSDFQTAAQLFPATLLWQRAYAIVEWGIGGQSCEAEMDFVNGACINIQASYVRIRVRINEVGASAILTDAVYNLAAFIGPGTRTSLPATRTVLLENVAAGAASATRFPIPPFARAVELFFEPAATVTGIVLRFFTISTAAAGAGQVLMGAGSNFHQPVAIPNHAKWFDIQNTGAVDALTIIAVFHLAL